MGLQYEHQKKGKQYCLKTDVWDPPHSLYLHTNCKVVAKYDWDSLLSPYLVGVMSIFLFDIQTVYFLRWIICVCVYVCVCVCVCVCFAPFDFHCSFVLSKFNVCAMNSSEVGTENGTKNLNSPPDWQWKKSPHVHVTSPRAKEEKTLRLSDSVTVNVRTLSCRRYM